MGETYVPRAQTEPVNGMAVASLIIGVLSWLLFLILLCLNFVILPLLTVATLGAGGALYICTLTVGCLSPLGWLIGAVLGYVARNQITQAGYVNTGLATGAFLTNLAGLVVTLLGACVIGGLILFSGGAAGLQGLQ